MMATLTLDRAQEQAMMALERANRIRTLRAGLKRDLAGGRVSVLDVLAAPPGWLLSARVVTVLTACPRVGRVNAMRVMSRAGIRADCTVGELSDCQRQVLRVDARLRELPRAPSRPATSPALRWAALDRANVLRLARAGLRVDVRDRTVSVLALLADPPECIGTLAVGDLLCWQPQWGVVRSRRVLARAGVRWDRRVGVLTARQRMVLRQSVRGAL